MTPLLRKSLALAALAAVGTGALLAWRHARAGATDIPPEAIVKVSRGPLSIVVRETGRIQPFSRVDLRSKVAGQVLRILVRTGDRVQAGQVLLELDATDLRRQEAQAAADVAIARAQLRAVLAGPAQGTLAEARVQLQEAEARREAADVEAARRHVRVLEARLGPDEDQARAQLHKAELALRSAREQLSRAVLRAPVAGTVVARSVEVGEMVTPGVAENAERRTLMTIADLSRLIVAAEVNQIDVARLRLGMAATVQVDALPGAQFEGRVHQIAPAAVPTRDKDVQLFPVEVLLEGRQTEGLRPGMSADVDIAVSKREGVLQLPVQAVRRERGASGSVAVLADEAGPARTRRRDVHLGVHNEQMVELLGGLAEGESVIIDPAPADGNVNRF